MPNRAKLPSSSPSAQTAIEAALAQNWKEAVRINSWLIASAPTGIDAYNRLGFAYLKLGRITAAKKAFAKVLKIDAYNQIALKNSKKLDNLKRKDLEAVSSHVSPLLFLEEPGKTKIVSLVNPAPIHTLVALSAGQEVALKPRNHAVEVRSFKNAYLGVLPDDLSFKLLKLLSAGNRYLVHIKSVGKNQLTVIIREISRGKRFAAQPTFTAPRTWLPMARGMVREGDTPDVTPTGEDSEEGETAPQTPGR